MVETAYSCKVCGATTLEPLPDYSSLPRVTSDCKPWPAGGRLTVCGSCGAIQKIPDRTWLDETAAIYGEYEIYHLSGGEEQVIFDVGSTACAPRSRRLVDFIVKTLALSQTGRLLDIGCGNGAGLTNFSKALPGWTLFGSELNDKALQILRQFPNFDTLFTCAPSDIPGVYDLVSLIHSLEHMPEPLDTVRNAGRLIADGGWLSVQVPDARTSPFDLLVADHLLHFTTATLGQIVNRAGFTKRILTDVLLKKELTFIGQQGEVEVTPSPSDPDEGRVLVCAHLQWLHDVIAAAQSVAVTGKQFGILGTSISGMWLFGALGDQVEFFVDEDTSRVGQTYQGRNIYRPEDAPAGANVFMPLIPDIAAAVAARCAKLPARFHVPPPYSKAMASHRNACDIQSAW